MTALEFELRILSGFHRGARVTLDDQLTLGSTHDYDVLLRDAGMAGQSAIIQLTATDWTLKKDEAAPERHNEFGKQLSIGGVAVTVDNVAAPWPLLVDLEPVEAEEVHEEEGEIHSGAPESDHTSSAEVQQLRPQSKGKRSLLLTVSLMAGGLVVGFLLVVAWLFLRAPTPNVEAAKNVEASKPVPKAQTVDLIAYRKALAELGLENKIRVDVKDDGIHLVGVVDSGEAVEALADRFATFSPRPGLSVSTADELVALGNAVVRRFSSGLQLACHEARCTLNGVALSATASQQAVHALATEVPQIRNIETHIQLPADIGTQFIDQLKKRHIEGFKADWDGHELLVSGKAKDDESEEFRQALHWLGEQCGDLIPFRVALAGQPAKAPERRAPSTSPFEIVAVVEGMFPYVTTTTGDNVMLGGWFRGYRLVAIQPDQVIFEGPYRLVFKR